MNNIKKFIVLSLIFFTPLSALDIDTCKIIRISQESLDSSTQIAKANEEYRTMQRWIIAGVATAVGVGLLYSQGYMSCQDKLRDDVIHKNDLKIDHIPLVQDTSTVSKYINGLGQSITNTTGYVARNIGSVVSSFAGKFLLNAGSQQIHSSWKYFHDVEKLSGFIHYTADIDKLFLIIKEFAVPFDIYSQRLSMDLNFGQQRILLAKFMQEMIEVVDNSDEWTKNRILSAMKKDYMAKTSSLQELQNFALNTIHYRQRIEGGYVDNSLEIEDFNRATLAEFCNILILEIEKIAAFVENKVRGRNLQAYFSNKVQTLIYATNLFAEKIEAKLAYSMNELHKQSKNGDGLFDIIADFNVQVQQYIEVLNYQL